MTTILPSELYDDPFTIIARIESGDVMPTAKQKPVTCYQCEHVRPALYEPPCSIHCCPSPRSGRCRLWEGS